MKKTIVQVLKELRETEFKVGDYVGLNLEVQENKLQAFNIDDNGIAMIDYDNMNSNIDKYNKIADDVIHAGDKEEVNNVMGMEIFYWVNIDFLNDWRDNYGYDEKAMTQEMIDDFKKVIDEEIVLEENGTNTIVRKEKILRDYILTDQYGGKRIKESLIETEEELIYETIGLTSNTYASSFIDSDRVTSEATKEMEDRLNSADLSELEEWAKDNSDLEMLYEGVE